MKFLKHSLQAKHIADAETRQKLEKSPRDCQEHGQRAEQSLQDCQARDQQEEESFEDRLKHKDFLILFGRRY